MAIQNICVTELNCMHVYCCDGLAYLSLWNQWVQLDIMNSAYTLDFATFSVFTVLYIYLQWGYEAWAWKSACE